MQCLMPLISATADVTSAQQVNETENHSESVTEKMSSI